VVGQESPPRPGVAAFHGHIVRAVIRETGRHP
jgi:hypothetical protein